MMYLILVLRTDQAAQAIAHQGGTICNWLTLLTQWEAFDFVLPKTGDCLFFAVAFLCGIMLTFFRPWALLFGIVGFLLLAYFYVAPPNSTGIYWARAWGNRYPVLVWHDTPRRLIFLHSQYSNLWCSIASTSNRSIYIGGTLLPTTFYIGVPIKG